MARLSVEHFRANSVMTPEKSRKSSRLRDMFKSRSSLSPSTTTDKRRDSADVSPLTSPTLKTGFEKVGLLPSERNSLAPTEKDPKVAHDPKDTLGANDTPEAMSTIAEKTEKQPEMVSSKTSNSLDDAFRELFEKHQKECAKDEAEASEQGTSKPVDGLSTDNSQRLYVLRPSDEMSNPSGNSNGTRTKILLANKNDPQVTDLRRNHEIDDDGTSRYDSKRHSQTAFVDFSRSVDRE